MAVRIRLFSILLATHFILPQNHVNGFSIISSHESHTNVLNSVKTARVMMATPLFATKEPLATAPTPDATTSSSEQGLGAWIPIASKHALRGLGPQQIRVMGLDLVVWVDNSSDQNKPKWSVMTDICPHRLAPLSQGRVDPQTGCIECPYHGWQFDNQGKLQSIPHGPDTPLINVRTAYFPTHEAGDLIFAFLPSSVHGEMFPQSMLPEHMFPTLRHELQKNVKYFVRDLPYSVDFLAENFMDPAHIPFAHHKLQSTREDAGEVPMSELVNNFTHIEASFQDISAGKPRDGIVSFQRPTMYHFRLRGEDGHFKSNLNIHIVPIEAGRSRALFTSPMLGKIPDFLSHAASNRFFNTDVWLHDTEYYIRTKKNNTPSYIQATTSDLGVKLFRKWWAQHGFKDAPPNTFGPAPPEALTKISRDKQIDPWENHSKHCASCRKALQNLKRIQGGALVSSVLSAIFLGRRRPLLGVAVSLLGLGIRNFAQRFATVIEGNPSRAGYGDRSAAHIENYSSEN